MSSLKSKGWATKSNAPWRATSAAVATVPFAEVTTTSGACAIARMARRESAPGHAHEVQVEDDDRDLALGHLVDRLLPAAHRVHPVAEGGQHALEKRMDGAIRVGD